MAIPQLDYQAEPHNDWPTSQATSVNRWIHGAVSRAEDTLVEETPVALCYNGVSHAVMMASPTELEDFALGFSLSEGILDSKEELLQVDTYYRAGGIELDLTISARRQQALKQRKRQLAGRTGCGLCGSDSLDHAIRPINRVNQASGPDDTAVQNAVILLEHNQPLQNLTGGVHAAAWCNLDGEIELLREDVGRHNALDKLIGALVKQGVEPNSGFLLMSSRASYEIIHKAAAAGIAHLVALSAPTAMAIRLADQAGIKVTGFARDGRHVHYSDLPA